MPAPAIGTFIRPVGVSYCLELVKVVPPTEGWNELEQWHLRRFGLSDDKTTPIKDGHQDIHYISGLKQVAPDVWKDEWDCDTPRWRCCPLYYRRMMFSGHQESLF